MVINRKERLVENLEEMEWSFSCHQFQALSALQVPHSDRFIRGAGDQSLLVLENHKVVDPVLVPLQRLHARSRESVPYLYRSVERGAIELTINCNNFGDTVGMALESD